MEDELTVVGVRKEVLTEPRHEKECRSAGQKKSGNKNGPPVDKRREYAVVGIPQPFESALERSVEAHERIP